MARRNDGTFRNLTLNLDSANSRGLAVNNEEFSPRLDQTWRQRYNKVVERYPLAKYAYDAVELLRTLNLWLTPPMLSATTKLLLPGRGVRRWWQKWQLRSVLGYLVSTEQILKPKDGQIEAKKTGAVDIGRYLPTILQLLGQMAKRDPNYPVASEYFDCGNALYDLGRYEDAIESYDKALEFKPNLWGAWYSRGIVLYDLGRYEDAIESYDQTLAVKFDKHEAWFNRGIALDDLGRYEEAIASYDQALAVKPDLHEAWDNRGYILSNLERYEEALISYDKALQIQPDHANAYYNKAYCYGLQKKIDLAIESLQHAITLDSKYRDMAKTDSDFDGIRDSDRFRELIGE
jgi:tetratricopeptide (TPR) repeat protein